MSKLNIPESWASANLSVLDVITGQTPKNRTKGRLSNFYKPGDLPSNGVGEVETSEEQIESDDVARTVILDSVLVTCIGTLGKVGLVKANGFFNQQINAILPTPFMEMKFIALWCSSVSFRKSLNELASGTTISIVNKAKFETLPLVVPPIAEQKRIVAKIELTNSKIKEIENCAKRVNEIITKYREALLQKAFRGKLAPQDPSDESASELIKRARSERTENSAGKKRKHDDLPQIKPEEIPFEIPKTWEWISLGDFSFVTKLAGFEYTEHIQLKDSGDVPVLRAQNVRKGYLDLSNLKYISSKVSNLLDRSSVRKKCLVMTFIGANIGDTAVIDPDTRFHLAPNVAKIEVESIIHHEFLMHYLLSSVGRTQVFKSMKSTAQPSLSMTTIRDIFVPLPPIKEQMRIATLLKNSFEIMSVTENQSETIKSTLFSMQNSILTSAFMGNLVQQIPSEGIGHGLIESIKSKIEMETSIASKQSKKEPRKRVKA